MEAGHFSASGIYDHLLEVALKYAFYMHALSACTDGGGGGGRPLHDYAFIATACLAGLVVLVGAVPPAPPHLDHKSQHVLFLYVTGFLCRCA